MTVTALPKFTDVLHIRQINALYSVNDYIITKLCHTIYERIYLNELIKNAIKKALRNLTLQSDLSDISTDKVISENKDTHFKKNLNSTIGKIE